jgi:hypothetical protein
VGPVGCSPGRAGGRSCSFRTLGYQSVPVRRGRCGSTRIGEPHGAAPTPQAHELVPGPGLPGLLFTSAENREWVSRCFPCLCFRVEEASRFRLARRLKWTNGERDHPAPRRHRNAPQAAAGRGAEEGWAERFRRGAGGQALRGVAGAHRRLTDGPGGVRLQPGPLCRARASSSRAEALAA